MKESELLKIYTKLRYIFREPYFFALPPQGWHKVDLKHLIVFISSLCFFHARLLQGCFSNSLSIPPTPLAPKVAWHLMSQLTFWLPVRGWKLQLLYIFRMLTHFSCTIFVAFPLSLVYLKTRVHILFLNSQNKAVHQRSVYNIQNWTLSPLINSSLTLLCQWELEYTDCIPLAGAKNLHLLKKGENVLDMIESDGEPLIQESVEYPLVGMAPRSLSDWKW